MRTISSWFETEMDKQTLHPLGRFKYDGTYYPTHVSDFGAVVIDADQVTAGSVTLGLINTDKTWNMFLSDITNLRKEGIIDFALSVDVGKVARAGCARSGISISNLLSPHTNCTLDIRIPMNGEWIAFFTGLGDEPRFEGAHVELQLRDKMAKMLEKKVGSGQGPVDYYTASYNPADLVWDLLTNASYGGLDNTASTANTDIDYTLWSDWKTDCAGLSLSLEAKLEGEYIGTVLEKVAELTHTIIFVRGDGKFAFYRYSPPAGIVYAFDNDNTQNQEVSQTFDGLLNDIRCYYNYDQALETWAGSVTASDATSQTNYGKVSHTEENTAVWHATQGSAQDYCNRRVNRFKDPRQFCSFETGIMGFVLEPGDLVNNDMDFWGYVSDVFEIRKLNFDLNVGKTRIEMLNVNFYVLGGFLLDDAFWGLLDEAYNPLY